VVRDTGAARRASMTRIHTDGVFEALFRSTGDLLLPTRDHGGDGYR